MLLAEPSKKALKTNWDAAFNKILCNIGVWIIVHDWEGRVMTTIRMRRDLYIGAFLA